MNICGRLLFSVRFILSLYILLCDDASIKNRPMWARSLTAFIEHAASRTIHLNLAFRAKCYIFPQSHDGHKCLVWHSYERPHKKVLILELTLGLEVDVGVTFVRFIISYTLWCALCRCSLDGERATETRHNGGPGKKKGKMAVISICYLAPDTPTGLSTAFDLLAALV